MQHDIELTKKGEAYAAAAFDQTANLRTDQGVFFLTLTRDRVSIATTIERLINLLDAMDPDPDLEDEPREPNCDELDFNGDEQDYSGTEDDGVAGYIPGGGSDGGDWRHQEARPC